MAFRPALTAALSMATWKRGWSTILAVCRPSRTTTGAGMSRHQMPVSVPAMSGRPGAYRHGGPQGRDVGHGGERLDGRRQVAVPGLAELEREAQKRRRGASRVRQARIVGLGQIDDPSVGPEVDRQ